MTFPRSTGLAGVLMITTALVTAAAASAPSDVDPQALAGSLQQTYDRVRDFSTDFVHSYRGWVLRKTVKESGRLLVKKPGKMRWTYVKPEEKVFVSDGRKMYSYIPADRQVYVTTVPSDDQASTPALFLAGKGNLLRDFEVSSAALPSDAPPDTVALRLLPRTKERDYESLILVVDRSTLQLRMLVADDRQGGQSMFSFSNLRENIGVSDGEFAFKIPRGADVITDTPK